MNILLAVSLGALGGTLAVAVVMIWYLEKRLADTGRHLEELYAQLESMLWKLGA